MSATTTPQSTAAITPHALTDDFIKAQLPDWLKNAKAEQLDALRDCLKAHDTSARQLSQATIGLLSPQQFAEQVFKPLLDGLDKGGHDVKALQWLDIRRGVSTVISTPYYEQREVRFPALLRLMQGFAQGARFFDGSGVVQPGSTTVLSGDADDFAARCRALDAGRQYQDLLDRQLSATTLALLATHQRSGFALACQQALMQGHLTEQQHTALRCLSNDLPSPSGAPLRASAGQLRMLDCTLVNALLIQLYDHNDNEAGVLLYLPFDHERPLRRFESFGLLTQYLAVALHAQDYKGNVRGLVRLNDQPGFLATLSKRLSDDVTDLDLDSIAAPDNVFALLARSQVARLRADGRLMLVSAADADHQAAERRIKRWEEIGLGLLGVAGMAVPAIGVVLLGKLLMDTLGEVYAGVRDWRQGHQHEALDHMIEVAKTVAVTAVTATGAALVARGFAGSAFVDALEPVELDGGKQRLWNHDLSVYESTPEQPVLQENGLYASRSRHWLRVDQRYYEVRQAAPEQPWRLCHPEDQAAFAPRVEHNGERCWRICLERPQEWDDSCAMLNRLWPHQSPLDVERTEQILTVAGVDQDELRGVLVQNRPAPVNLRDTLRRFEADARITAVFEAAKAPNATLEDAEVLAWCRTRPGTQTVDATDAAAWLADRQGELQGMLLEHLTRIAHPSNSLFALVKRDFPGLPDAYAEEAVRDGDAVVEQVARVEARVPYTVATRARSLLQLARLNRAVEALYLNSVYCEDAGLLVMQLLRNLPMWPSRVGLELRAQDGRMLAITNPAVASDARIVLTRRNGEFRLYDAQGSERDLEVAAPGDLFQAIVAALDADQRSALKLDPSDPAQSLRLALIKALPAKRSDWYPLLDMQASTPWFNPGKRLPDGRVGYPLGGRSSRNATRNGARILRERIRALYPVFDDAQVESKVAQLQRDPLGRGALQALLFEENNYNLLDNALRGWAQTHSPSVSPALRGIVARRLREAWRYESEVIYNREGEVQGRVLDLSNCRIQELPTLPEQVDLTHITNLVMCRMELREVPGRFLRCFDGLRFLNVSNNQLIALPPSIAQCENLIELRVSGNRIEMDAADEQLLAQMPHLRTIDLSHNPIRVLNLRFNEPTQLRRLYVSRCRLQAMPAGLQNCAFLSFADLSGNQIQTVPGELLSMPAEFRYRLRTDFNPMSAQMRRELYWMDPVHNHGAEIVRELIPTSAKERWIALAPEAERGSSRALWERLEGMADSRELFRLLSALTETADFGSASEYLAGQLWELLQAIDGDATLRELIFANSSEPGECVDRIADRFSGLLIQRMVHQATTKAATGKGGEELLKLGRQLFRLEQVDLLARDEAARRAVGGAYVDVLEVVIGYRIALTKELDLPGQPRNMQFVSLADVTDALKQSALAAVKASETDEALAKSLAGREFWRKYVDARHAAVFAEILERFGAEGTKLDEDKSLSSAEYDRRWRVLKVRREQEEHAVTIQFAHEALNMQAAGQALDSVESAQPD
ncbi:NEL-type E3 ubiquitin ligase domain-containing protein [Pseudomonas sp. GD03858]|uniref:NEL-type E3 ubiquitin ligase domain-containing protein n=1 Tax=unclassified Pseudomonas TaxID=196821 RepID=UPI00244B5E9C|nr:MULTISPECIES: NEL-type E3 ubiquitin ligase domain-containing protein [unclassified Pseudomonas]MDH0647677.1 NEL-type E3 ubiquitin ligase domain-containing protein [Pseudomonas sp. GD03867]MDH0664924.1 NEL-type E3 ubiquitin ligase domain-containing protein [Pseudomonas sp. GD03858]